MNDWYVNRGKMGVLEAFHVAESFYEPIVDIGPSQGRLYGLQQKAKPR